MEFNATFLVSAISFIVFVFVMNTIFYKPLEKIISEREKLVSDTLNEARDSIAERERLLVERETKLQNATDECKQLVAKSVEKANLKAKELTNDAKVKSVQKISDEKDVLNEQKQQAKEVLDNKIKDLANEIVAKVMV